jgi:hypothetical protein
LNTFIRDQKQLSTRTSWTSIWYDNLNKVKEYIDKNKKKPTESDKDEEIQKLGKWISLQQLNYNKKTMKDDNIYSEWSQFMIEYQEYFLNKSACRHRTSS